MAVTPPEVSGVQYAAFLNRQNLNVRVVPVTDPEPIGWIMLLNGAHVDSLGIGIEINGDPLRDLVEHLDRQHKFIFQTGSDPDHLEPAPDPFAAPAAAPAATPPTALKSFDEVRTDFPSGYVIDIVRPGEQIHSEWARYNDPVTEVPDSLDHPQIPGVKLVELINGSDLGEVWWVYFRNQKPTGGTDLSKLGDADPKPLEQGADYGKFGQADEVNRIIARRPGGGTRKPNFGFYPPNTALRKGWEPVIDPKSLKRSVRDARVLIDGKEETLSVVLDGLKGVSVAHAEDTSWDSFEADQGKAKWPPFEEHEQRGAPASGGGKAVAWVGQHKSPSLLLALLALVGLYALGATLGVLADIVIFGALFASAIYLALRVEGPARSAAWVGLSAGLLACVWLAVYGNQALGDTVAAAFAWGLAWGAFIGLVAMILWFCLRQGDEPWIADEYLRPLSLAAAIGLVVAFVAFLPLMVYLHNREVADHGQTEDRCGPNGTEPNSAYCQPSITGG